MHTLTRRNFVKAASGAALSGAAIALAGCGSSEAEDAGSAAETAASGATTITVGASPSPHAEILGAVTDLLADEGYELEIVEYSDYVQPNVAVDDGSLDANYFQHYPYLEQYNEENGTDLANAGAIHFEPMSVYSDKHDSIEDVPDGARIAVPSDATNEARALMLLEAHGIIGLAEGAGLAATGNDIVDNPHNIELYETEAASVPRALADVDFAVVNGNYALSSGIVDDHEALAAEDADSEAAQTYANIVCCRAGEEESDKVAALVAALQSDTVRDFIEETYQGTVITVF